jgi:hypothetical protein
MKFIIYNGSGEILSVGECPDDEVENQCPAGAFIMAGHADPARDAVNVETGAVIHGGRAPDPEPEYSYRNARAAAYPSTEEQIDMLWHAMDADPSKRLEPFYSRIKAVKDAYPKGGTAQPGDAIIYGVEGL